MASCGTASNTHFEFSYHAFTQPESCAKIISRLGGSSRNFNIATYQTLRCQLSELWIGRGCLTFYLAQYYSVAIYFLFPVPLANNLLPLALQPTVGFGLSNNFLPFFPICHQLSPSSHSQHLKISFYFLFPSFPGSSPSSRPFQFFSEDLFGHPILLHSL